MVEMTREEPRVILPPKVWLIIREYAAGYHVSDMEFEVKCVCMTESGARKILNKLLLAEGGEWDDHGDGVFDCGDTFYRIKSSATDQR